MTYAAANIKTRLDRFEVALRGSERAFTLLNVRTRLSAILVMDGGHAEINPGRRRIREIVEGARGRAAFA